MQDMVLGESISNDAPFQFPAQDNVSLLSSRVEDWTEKVYYMHQTCIFLAPNNEEQCWLLLFDHPWSASMD
jgi:hypothetical protein